MSYYNRESKKLNLDTKNMVYLKEGGCGQVLCDAKIIFKTYFPSTPISCRLSPELFDILKSINNPHFVKLFDIYNEMNFLELFRYRHMNAPFIVDAYTAKLYFEDKMNALYKHKDYILDNFRELEILFDIFTDNSIKTDDIKKDNCILGMSKITIIDPDSYTISSSNEELIIHNKRKLLNLFKSICINGIYGTPNYWELTTLISAQVANIDVNKNTEVASEINKILVNVKRPIDQFIK